MGDECVKISDARDMNQLTSHVSKVQEHIIGMDLVIDIDI